MNESNNNFDENLELSKSLTASVWERLGNLGISKEFDEAKHPRGAGGRFGSGSGGGAESARTARTVGQMRDAISHHESRQEMHRKAADALRAAHPVRGERSAQKHDEAAYQHKIAAENFRDVVSNLYPSVVISHDDARFASGRAEAATREASGA